ncbi:MAG: hypothetical protein HOD37_16220 [Bacteroidetes bacterium]|nr:hypothetical protein [Bacteroidota bacterium]
MTSQSIKSAWKKLFSSAPEQLGKMKSVDGLISAFNANIDAVIKVSGTQLLEIIEKNHFDQQNLLAQGERNIQSPEDAIRGLLHCFRNGIAEEWLLRDETVFRWLQNHIGYDKLQMGGQGGIVANVMAVCGVNPVYVHCASLPEEQAGLFLNLDNLLTTDSQGQLGKAHGTIRQEDIPLIHWIIEFDIGDQITLNNEVITCPKSNRFIATYDPLNFKLAIDPNYARAMSQSDLNLDYVILSGYQMLRENLPDGGSGRERIDTSIDLIRDWKKTNPNAILHLEMASTQDESMRKHLLDSLAKEVDSLGFNERELIDLLEVMGEDECLNICNVNTNSVNLFEGMKKVQAYTGCPRLQLHMFGLYMTLQKKGFRISPEQNRNGMQRAAVIAAAKAGTGAIDKHEVLLWAKDHEVSDTGIKELKDLTDHIQQAEEEQSFTETGISRVQDFDLIAVPTILIEKPITLVGMGDTISSISLVGAQ